VTQIVLSSGRIAIASLKQQMSHEIFVHSRRRKLKNPTLAAVRAEIPCTGRTFVAFLTNHIGSTFAGATVLVAYGAGRSGRIAITGQGKVVVQSDVAQEFRATRVYFFLVDVQL
jgi:hypothetical protein